MAGPAAKLLPSLSPAQLATVVEALGAAGVNDTELLKVSASDDAVCTCRVHCAAGWFLYTACTLFAGTGHAICVRAACHHAT
jgi:hypothetical protein